MLPEKRKGQELVAQTTEDLTISKNETAMLVLRELEKRLNDPAVAYKIKNSELFAILRNTLDQGAKGRGDNAGVTFNVITGLPNGGVGQKAADIEVTVDSLQEIEDAEIDKAEADLSADDTVED